MTGGLRRCRNHRDPIDCPPPRDAVTTTRTYVDVVAMRDFLNCKVLVGEDGLGFLGIVGEEHIIRYTSIVVSIAIDTVAVARIIVSSVVVGLIGLVHVVVVNSLERLEEVLVAVVHSLALWWTVAVVSVQIVAIHVAIALLRIRHSHLHLTIVGLREQTIVTSIAGAVVVHVRIGHDVEGVVQGVVHLKGREVVGRARWSWRIEGGVSAVVVVVVVVDDIHDFRVNGWSRVREE